jgi:hypothetical protein
MNKFDKREKKQEIFLGEFKYRKDATTNEIINGLFEEGIDRYGPHLMKKVGWRWFCHMNKVPAILERKGLIKFTGKYRIGETGLKEKVWRAL